MPVRTRLAFLITFSVIALTPSAAFGQFPPRPANPAPKVDVPPPTEHDQLYDALKTLDMDTLKKLDALNPDLIKGADAGGPPLIQYVLNYWSGTSVQGQERVLEGITYLLDHGANPNGVDGKSSLPLHQAAVMGDPSLIRLLLSRGVDPNSDRDNALLFDCILHYHGDKQSAEDIPVMQDMFGALTDRHNKILFAPGRKIDGSTPLTSLVMSRIASVENVQVLLALGADLKERANVQPDNTEYQVDLAGPVWLPSYFWGQGFRDIGLIEASIFAQRADLLRFFLNKGLSANHRNATGNTPMDYAIVAGPIMVSILLANHADPNVRDNMGNTPVEINLACQSDRYREPMRDTLKAALKATDLSRKNRQGITPLMQIIQSHLVMDLPMMLYVYHPADKFERAEAATAQDDAIAVNKLLVAMPALAWQRLPDGRTLLHMAAL